MYILFQRMVFVRGTVVLNCLKNLVENVPLLWIRVERTCLNAVITAQNLPFNE